MSCVFFLFFFILFKLTMFKNIEIKIINSLKENNKYKKDTEKKIKCYFDRSFILFILLYNISNITNSVLFIKYFDIIPFIYLYCKLIFLYKD